MAWALDLDWVRKAGENDDNEEDNRVVKNVLQVPGGVLHRGVYLPLTVYNMKVISRFFLTDICISSLISTRCRTKSKQFKVCPKFRKTS